MSQRKSTRRRQRSSLTVVAPLLMAMCSVLVWDLLAWRASAVWLLPHPQLVAERFFSELLRPQLWSALWLTGQEALGGCVMGTTVALPLAYLIYRNRVVAAALDPFVGLTQAIPAIAIAPLLVVWVGYGTWAIATLCSLMVFFPILLSTTLGLRHLDEDVLDAARLDGASGYHLLISVEAPMALPAITSGLRNGFTLSVTGAVVGEMVMGGSGLGTVLTIQRNAADTPGMFVSIGLVCALAMGTYLLIFTFERWWKRRYM